MTAEPKKEANKGESLAGQLPAADPLQAYCPISMSGLAAGHMKRETFCPADRWWNTSSRFSAICWRATYRTRLCANTVTMSG